jgi:hypothetical protein
MTHAGSTALLLKRGSPMPSSPSQVSQPGTVPAAAVTDGAGGITPLKGGGAGGWGGLGGGAYAGGWQANASGHTLGV